MSLVCGGRTWRRRAYALCSYGEREYAFFAATTEKERVCIMCSYGVGERMCVMSMHFIQSVCSRQLICCVPSGLCPSAVLGCLVTRPPFRPLRFAKAPHKSTTRSQLSSGMWPGEKNQTLQFQFKPHKSIVYSQGDPVYN